MVFGLIFIFVKVNFSIYPDSGIFLQSFTNRNLSGGVSYLTNGDLSTRISLICKIHTRIKNEVAEQIVWQPLCKKTPQLQHIKTMATIKVTIPINKSQ